MIHFGPAGNSDSFYKAGYKSTVQAMPWVQNLGLTAFEYSFGRGVRLKEETANTIRDAAKEHEIALSIHAPYFINLASDDSEKFEKNIRYFSEASQAAIWLGAKRVVFHPGSASKMDRAEAFALVKQNLTTMLAVMDDMGFSDVTYCPESMGKISQIGDLEETIALVNLDERLLPTIDFGHLHTRGIGALNTKEDFEVVIDALINGIGYERTKNMHIHFSKIAYSKAGERYHVTFADEGYGPDFAHLAPILVREKLEPTIICESKGTMAEDALSMKAMYEQALKNQK